MPIRIAIGDGGGSGFDMLEHSQEEIDGRSVPVPRRVFVSVLLAGGVFVAFGGGERAALFSEKS
jgi:hypothetical protein